MNKLIQGVAIGIFISIVGSYTGVIKNSFSATSTENTHLQKNLIMEA